MPWDDGPQAVTYGNGIYIVVGAGGKIATSENGISWTSRNLGSSSNGLNDVHYGNGLYVIVGEKDSIYTSSDGIDWSLKYSNGVGGNDTLNSVTYGNARFIAVGNDRTFVTSTDGTNWSLTCTDCTQVDYHGITYGNGLFVGPVVLLQYLLLQMELHGHPEHLELQAILRE